ncbi:MAG: hypothetical protein ABEL76_12315 [Bradymonadaceae bacterium]
MSPVSVAIVAVGGVGLVVFLVWLFGWDEQPPMESLEEARSVLEDELGGSTETSNSVLGDDSLTALFVVSTGEIYAVHTVGAHRNALDLTETAEDMTRDRNDLIVHTSSFDTPEVSIRLEDDDRRRTWARRLDRLV